MEIFYVILAMIIAGLIAGYLAGLIWKNERPIGLQGDYIVAIITTIVVGLLDWYVIPAMGFSDTLKYIGIIAEPLLGALAVLWIVRKAKQ
ncbi:MAG: hypothetical protein IZT55_02820 [Anaerolineae bacterium]|nr:hypothetical protein [Anaerolineae bacterium]